MKVLFVCLGNICRSPLAEGLFRHHVQTLQLDKVFEIDSCGTGNWHAGELPDPRTRQSAKDNGITLTHRARQIRFEDFDYYDHLLVMDHNNYSDVIAIRPEMSHKVNLLTHFHPEFKNHIVPDPYYGDKKDFDNVFEMLNTVTKDLVYFLHKSQ